jgi:NAD(P)-dependent dehydrogenase (short-subunit alcohol dehydrogenase family)
MQPRASTQKVAVVTGAGSGVGQATALMLLAGGWSVALVGRRLSPLEETARLAGSPADQALSITCDVGDHQAVAAMAETVMARLGAPEALINAAGTNTPKRAIAELSLQDYRQILDTNLDGAYYCVQAFLPAMRERRRGTIVNVVSIAGLRAVAKAGVAYSVSKFGMTGLTQAINDEERANGIRACAIFPGDINTPILDLRPNPPPQEARQLMLQPEDVAQCVLLALTLPDRAVVEELVIAPR